MRTLALIAGCALMAVAALTAADANTPLPDSCTGSESTGGQCAFHCPGTVEGTSIFAKADGTGFVYAWAWCGHASPICFGMDACESTGPNFESADGYCWGYAQGGSFSCGLVQ